MIDNDDSDDDFEAYFLKPVNEYNIVDKIKEANKELFATPQPSSPASLPRKVTFRAVLEDYEPQEQYAIEIDVSSITTVEGFLEDASPTGQDENQRLKGDTDKQRELLNSVEEVDDEEEIEEICEEILELNVEQSHTDISEIIVETTNPSSEKENNNNICESIKQNCSPSDQNSVADDSSGESDDNLSVIVASYIADDPKKKFRDDEGKSVTKQRYKRTFSLRRKKANKKEAEDITEMKLNYKICCEYKNATNEPLPKYTGYLSTYGLSKDQWNRREKLLDKKKMNLLEKEVQTNEKNLEKMVDNERAFTNWLKNKMRCPINKTKNMFDFRAKKLRVKAK